MEELCIDDSRRRVVAWAKCIQDDLKIQLHVYRTNRNQTYRYSNSPTYILHEDKTEHARTIFCVKLSINNHIVRLVHKNHIIQTCLMYHVTFFNFYKIVPQVFIHSGLLIIVFLTLPENQRMLTTNKSSQRQNNKNTTFYDHST